MDVPAIRKAHDETAGSGLFHRHSRRNSWTGTAYGFPPLRRIVCFLFAIPERESLSGADGYFHCFICNKMSV